MWFRVELNKDGSIASCTQVAASAENGKLVRFVEADTKESAIGFAQKWYALSVYHREKNKQRRQQRIAAKICTYCGKSPPRDGRETCEACKKKGTMRTMDARKRRARGDMSVLSFDASRTAEKKYADTLLANRARNSRATIKLRVLREVLSRWNEVGEGAIEWVRDEIMRLEGKEGHELPTAAE